MNKKMKTAEDIRAEAAKKVTGNRSKMAEKIECAVCGRDGFLRFPDSENSVTRVEHPHGPPCGMPPRVETHKVQAPNRYPSWRRLAAA